MEGNVAMCCTKTEERILSKTMEYGQKLEKQIVSLKLLLSRVRPSTHPSVRLSVHPSVCRSVTQCENIPKRDLTCITAPARRFIKLTLDLIQCDCGVRD